MRLFGPMMCTGAVKCPNKWSAPLLGRRMLPRGDLGDRGDLGGERGGDRGGERGGDRAGERVERGEYANVRVECIARGAMTGDLIARLRKFARGDTTEPNDVGLCMRNVATGDWGRDDCDAGEGKECLIPGDWG